MINKEVLKSSFSLSENRFGFWFFITFLLLAIALLWNLGSLAPETPPTKTYATQKVLVTFNYKGKTYTKEQEFELVQNTEEPYVRIVK